MWILINVWSHNHINIYFKIIVSLFTGFSQCAILKLCKFIITTKFPIFKYVDNYCSHYYNHCIRNAIFKVWIQFECNWKLQKKIVWNWQHLNMKLLQKLPVYFSKTLFHKDFCLKNKNFSVTRFIFYYLLRFY